MTSINMRLKEFQGIAGALAEQRDRVTNIKEEMEAEFEQMSETAQQGEKGERITEITETLDSVIGQIEEAISELEAI